MFIQSYRNRKHMKQDEMTFASTIGKMEDRCSPFEFEQLAFLDCGVYKRKQMTFLDVFSIPIGLDKQDNFKASILVVDPKSPYGHQSPEAGCVFR